MRILISLILSLFILSANVFAAQSFDEKLNWGMEQYKKGNTHACLAVMKKLAKDEPVNSYVQYYLGISYAKLGDVLKAKEAYEKVILLNQDAVLVSYSRQGLEAVKKVAKKNNIKIDKPEVIAEKKEEKKSFFKKIKKEDKPEKAKKVAKSTDSPTDAEVANAIKVLKRAGLLNVNLGVGNAQKINPYAQMNPYSQMMGQNPEMMQMNMLMGSMSGNSSSKNSSMDMLPFLMMQQSQNSDGKKNMSPEIMQIMMNNMMMDGMSSLTLDKNK